MRRDVIHVRERTTASNITTETVERNQGESHTNGASSPPPLSLLFFSFSLFFLFFLRGEREGPPKGPLQNHSPSLIFFLFFLMGKDQQSE